MREVVIAINKEGKPYVRHCPRKVTVRIVEDSPRSFRKVVRTLWYKFTH